MGRPRVKQCVVVTDERGEELLSVAMVAAVQQKPRRQSSETSH
jgi:hypothetical protein